MPKPSVRNSRKPLDSSIDISFYVDGWEMALDEQIATYKFLLELVTHPKVHSIMVSEKLKRPRKKSADPELEERFKELDAALPKELKKEFDKFFPLIVNADRFNVLRVYSQQMIVVAYTLFEGILEDFVTSLFGRYPERMYEYIGVETNLRGK